MPFCSFIWCCPSFFPLIPSISPNCFSPPICELASVSKNTKWTSLQPISRNAQMQKREKEVFCMSPLGWIRWMVPRIYSFILLPIPSVSGYAIAPGTDFPIKKGRKWTHLIWLAVWRQGVTGHRWNWLRRLSLPFSFSPSSLQMCGMPLLSLSLSIEMSLISLFVSEWREGVPFLPFSGSGIDEEWVKTWRPNGVIEGIDLWGWMGWERGDGSFERGHDSDINPPFSTPDEYQKVEKVEIQPL